ESSVCNVVRRFVDCEIDMLLALESKTEVTVTLAVIGAGPGQSAPRMDTSVPSLALEVNRLSKEEVDYPIIWDTNEASQLKTKLETESWKRSLGPFKRTVPLTTSAFPLRDSEEDLSARLDDVILL